MERGTDREWTAVRERWAALERRRASVTRLLGGFSLVSGGVVLLLLAAAQEVCFTTAEGGVIDCAPAMGLPLATALALFGVAAVGCGLWTCWTTFRE